LRADPTRENWNDEVGTDSAMLRNVLILFSSFHHYPPSGVLPCVSLPLTCCNGFSLQVPDALLHVHISVDAGGFGKRFDLLDRCGAPLGKLRTLLAPVFVFHVLEAVHLLDGGLDVLVRDDDVGACDLLDCRESALDLECLVDDPLR
jgi:hypothetical protein